MRVVVVLAGRRLLLGWADLLRARSLGAVPVIPVLALVGLVRRAASLHGLIALVALLLVVRHPALLEDISECSDSVPVASVEPVAPELPQLSIGHLLRFLDLLGIELYLSGIDGVRATAMHFIVSFVWWLHVTIVIVVLGGLRSSLAACLPILLSNPALELIDGAFLQFLAHDLFFPEPRVLRLPRLVHIRRVALRVRRLWMPLRALGSVGLLRVWSRHVEHHIVKLFVGIARWVDVRCLGFSRASGSSTAALPITRYGDPSTLARCLEQSSHTIEPQARQ